jgi:hypothetical protein
MDIVLDLISVVKRLNVVTQKKKKNIFQETLLKRDIYYYNCF